MIDTPVRWKGAIVALLGMVWFVGVLSAAALAYAAYERREIARLNALPPVAGGMNMTYGHVDFSYPLWHRLAILAVALAPPFVVAGIRRGARERSSPPDAHRG